MSKGIKHSKPALGMLLAASLAIGQGGVSYLSQKLLVENTIKDRIQDALSKIIDSHKYVINVSVELEIMDEVEEQITVLSPRRQVQKQSISPAEETAQVLLEMQAQMMEESEAEREQYSIGLPIPGFEVDISERKTAKKPKQVLPFLVSLIDCNHFVTFGITISPCHAIGIKFHRNIAIAIQDNNSTFDIYCC